MGTGTCSRRQKSLLQTGFCLLAVLGLGSGVLLYNYIIQQAKTSEALAVRYKQQQDNLSAQLQVVYEHRSRLERSLQKERSEHKKTKEDFLVYKLEAQEALNNEKQDSMNRYGALGSQLKILKNQQEELKKQLSDLQEEHSTLKLEHQKTLETNNQKLSQLRREKDNEFIGLQDTISKLKEERKLLRKAHQDIHTQLLSAQGQIDEFRKLKDALRKMPSFQDIGDSSKKVFKTSESQLLQNVQGNERPKANSPIVGAETFNQKKFAPHEVQIEVQDISVLQNHRLLEHLNRTPSLTQDDNVSSVVRFTRTVNSLQGPKEGGEEVTILQIQQPQHGAIQNDLSRKQSVVQRKDSPTMNALSVHEQVPIQSWQDIVNEVNARMTKTEDGSKPASVNDASAKQKGNLLAVNWGQGIEHRAGFNKADAGMIDREDDLQSQKQHTVQESVISDDVADPAKDPNNQGEDEFEEAEIDRPDFYEKNDDDKENVLHVPVQNMEEAKVAQKSREEAEEQYQEDQEQDIEEDLGEQGNGENKRRPDIQDGKNKQGEYY
ncbi:Golgi integral membrane protein 4 isoform X1 [Bombina bombina]|uniref:Golgi integral membrane protein 4 isoform X1 n=1 Tax=Bombina bombina TaxID=8345 RepID=UPI00235B1E80|nr:Golgi integral membrane protein 4 isoform X1 [Bombina bombina]